jgi:hypothetical protein
VTILTAIPSTITAGDSVAITLSLSDYPAPTWSVSLALAGVDTLTVTSAASGTDHAIAITAGQTSALGAGAYQYRVRAINGATVETIETGVVTVAADIGALAAGEGVSYWVGLKKAAEDALIMLMNGGAVQMSTIMGRQTMFRSPADCMKVIAACEARLTRERRRSAFGSVSVAFTR